MLCKIKPIRKNCVIPAQASAEAAGYDLSASLAEPITLKPFCRALIPTGFCMELEPGTEAQVRPRSGLALKKGVTVLNAPGTIDSDYRGEVGVLLINLSEEDFVVEPGMRVAQMVFSKLEDVVLTIADDDLTDTDRGAGGYGSTGEK